MNDYTNAARRLGSAVLVADALRRIRRAVSRPPLAPAS